MIAAVLGIVAGLLIALGPWSILAEPVNHLNDTLVKGGYSFLDWTLGLGGPELAAHPISDVLQIFFSTAMPGVVAVALVVAARAAAKVRRMVSSILLIVAFSSFIYMSVGDALTLSILALILAALLSLGQGLVITLPLIAFATVMAVTYGTLLWTGNAPAVGRGALELTAFTDGNGLQLWRATLMFVGVAPFVYAVMAALREPGKSK